MTGTDEIRFEVVDPLGDDAQWAIGEYFAEIDARFARGFDPGDALTAGAHLLTAPSGVFVVARRGDEVVACGGVQTIDPVDSDPPGTSVGEIKRMWVSPAARGRRLGARLLADLEARAWAMGHDVVRLDTNEVLHEAIAMYQRCGYVAIDRYNDNPYPTHWFEKPRPAEQTE